MKAFFELLIFSLFYSLGKLIALLPLRILYFFSDCLYPVIYYVIGYRKKVVLNNLRNAFPEKSEQEIIKISKQFYRHFCDIMIEIIKLLHISPEELNKRIHFTDVTALNKEYESNRHILSVLGHFNNWEWASGLAMQCKFEFIGIYKPLTNKYFDNLMIKLRTQHGSGVVPMSQTARYLLNNIKNGKLTLISFIADQSPTRGETQYYTNFFNQKTPVFLGIEKLAQKTKQPVYFFNIKKIKRGYYEADYTKLCDDASKLKPYELTDMHTKALEDQIRANPQYWLWSHRRWKHKPEEN
jgi:Kdo2-lipid IVA lauroyltransferase/acyltransferase